MPLVGEDRREYDVKRRARITAGTQEIYDKYGKQIEAGPKNKSRRKKGEKSLLDFCKIYGSEAFTLPWSENHRKAAAKIEQAVNSGDMFAFAMPRGSGKTTLSRWAVLWATLCGYSPYVVLIGATQSSAERALKNLKTTLRFNELLLEDFPEAICPIKHLQGEARKASGQKWNGEPTDIQWAKSQIIYATIPKAPCSGAIIDVTGIEGDIRGRQLQKPDGRVVRPTLCICDDPQTRDSARSLSQSEQREAVLSGDIKYMAGPDRPLGVVMPCTVIHQGDMADRMLDRKLHPEWQGEKTKMMESFPTDDKLWEEYERLRFESFAVGGKGEEATAYYAEHQEEMDAGAVATWPERFFPGELSAIQSAMNLKLLDEAAFYAECQNEPLSGQSSEVAIASAEQIIEHVHPVQRGGVPEGYDHVTGYIDISETVLWWMVCAWKGDFTGAIVDCGAWPEQPLNYFTLRSVKRTLLDVSESKSFEGALQAGLDSLLLHLCGREWLTETGTALRIERLLIDANWGQSTRTVESVCRRSPFGAVLFPSHGRGITAANKPLNDIASKPKPGEKRGLHWRIVRNESGTRRVIYDTNYWKTFVFNRFAVPVGDPGTLHIFQGKHHSHRMLVEQLTSEYPIRTEGRGRIVEQWEQRAEHTDNHWLDGLVGNAVSASIIGAVLDGTASPRSMSHQKPMSFAEMKKQAKRK